jgi:hypothetical protein
MTIKVREIAGSEQGAESLNTAEATIEMVTLSNVRSEQRSMLQCRAAVFSYLNTNYGGGFVLDSGYPLFLDKLSRDYDDDGDCWTWKADYNYKPPEATIRWSFDTTGGTIRVTHSKATNKYPNTTASPSFNGAVQVQNGEAQGTDIIIPALKLTATYRWPKNTVTPTYVNLLASMSGTVNSDAFGVYAAGELLFLGASGEIVPNISTEIQYQFAASANATGLTIGAITGIAKKGHEFLWVLFEDDEDTGAKRLVKKPLAAYVERVYTEATFSSLGIV